MKKTVKIYVVSIIDDKGESVLIESKGTVQIIGPVNTDHFHPSDYAEMKPSGDGDERIVQYTYYENNCALVAKISCGAVSYLSLADILEDEAAELLKEKKSALRADILKLSHHGTGSGNTEELLAAVQPSNTFV